MIPRFHRFRFLFCQRHLDNFEFRKTRNKEISNFARGEISEIAKLRNANFTLIRKFRPFEGSLVIPANCVIKWKSIKQRYSPSLHIPRGDLTHSVKVKNIYVNHYPPLPPLGSWDHMVRRRGGSKGGRGHNDLAFIFTVYNFFETFFFKMKIDYF